MNDTNGMWWDISRPLSYNCLFNMICGPRGCGKTFGAKKFVTKDNIRTDGENEFIYMRRYKEELSDIDTFFDDLIAENAFPGHDLEVRKHKYFYIDGKLAGRVMTLSQAVIKKSTPFPKVKTIIFDEFIIDTEGSVYHYLRDEVTAFLEAYESIARLRDVRVLFLSNAITVVNPYYLFFELEFPKNGKDITTKNDVLLQYYDNNVYKEAKNATRFGKMIAGTDYGKYAIDNVALRDDESFIRKRTPKCTNMFNVSYGGQTLGVWRDTETWDFYVSEKFDPGLPNFIFTLADMRPNTTLLKGRKIPAITAFVEATKNGQLYYESNKIAGICKKILKMCV